MYGLLAVSVGPRYPDAALVGQVLLAATNEIENTTWVLAPFDGVCHVKRVPESWDALV